MITLSSKDQLWKFHDVLKSVLHLQLAVQNYKLLVIVFETENPLDVKNSAAESRMTSWANY